MRAALDRSTRTLLATCALLAGCANFTAEQCRAANWYSLGEQDALIYGLRPQIDQIAYQCQKVGEQVSEKAYMEGWVEGDRERQVRMSRSSGSM